MKNLKRILSVVVLTIVAITLSTTVFAENSSTYYNGLQNEAIKNSQDTQEQLNNVEGQIDEVLQEVADLNSSILEYEGEIEQLTAKAQELDKSIAVKEKDLAEKKKTLENRLVAMYMKKETTFLDVVLSGKLMNFISNQDIAADGFPDTA